MAKRGKPLLPGPGGGRTVSHVIDMTEIQPSAAAGFRVERRTPPERLDVLSREILQLKDDLNAVILAHNYLGRDIQDLAV